MSSKLIPAVGVEFQFLGRTPRGELVRVNYYPHNPFPALAQELLAVLGLLEPVIECPGQILGILKDSE